MTEWLSLSLEILDAKIALFQKTGMRLVKQFSWRNTLPSQAVSRALDSCMLSVSWLFVQTWPTSFMPNRCYCVMHRFWMPSKYTQRDVAFGYFLECDLKRKTELLGIMHYKQKEKSLLLSHFDCHTSSWYCCMAGFEFSACWAFPQVLTYIFRSPL